MTSWLHNRPAALLIGLALGTAIQEALRTAIDGFVLLGSFGDQLVGIRGDAGAGIILILMLTALIGGLVAGLVTALLCHSRWTSVTAGVLLAIPSVALASIALEGGILAALHAAPPVCGAAFGARLVLGSSRRPADAGIDSPRST